ncbi:Signal transduction histidine kinase [Cyclonatronum proteinivorum]|uniref:histidine kinase n=1 Tax=Cyclonatronum proteinivorum TaxID=1457365 RepID=A0A345UG81_9BACT|nr:ATP-binding protein [Cyclonatronum proteinivorum]AXI99482.1 Signal transduction histidine kinase [Cyclonatronum proteinivorum]
MNKQAEAFFFDALKKDPKLFDFTLDFGVGGVVFFNSLQDEMCFVSPRAAALDETTAGSLTDALQKLRLDYLKAGTQDIPVSEKLVLGHKTGLLMECFVHVMVRKNPDSGDLSFIAGIAESEKNSIKRRRSYKQAFAENEKFKRSMVEALPDLVIHCDYNGTYIDIVNYSEDKKLLYDKSDMLGKRVSEVLANSTGVKIEEAIRKAVDEGKLQLIKYNLQIKGQLQYFEARIAPYMHKEVIALVRNITDEFEALQKLTRTKEALQQTNEIALVGFFEHDFLENRTYWSKTFKTIIEETDETEPDFRLTLERLSSPEKTGGLKEIFDSIKNEKKNSLGREIEILTPTGKKKWLNCKVMAEYHKVQCVRIFGTVQDITVRKKAELEQQQLISITKRQNEQLKNFSGIVSHNLRSHASNLKGLLDMMAEENPSLAQNEMFSYLAEVSENLTETISNLEDIAKITLENNNQLHRLSLGVVVAKTVSQVRVLAEQAGVEIINLIPLSVHVNGIPAYLDSIVLNFLTNAIKYRSEERASYVKLFSAVKGPYTVLYIEDNGLGINLKRHGDNLFKLYKTFHRNKDSKGIGLFITRNQIESMGGHIEVRSEPGSGTTFSVFFPKVHAANTTAGTVNRE